MRDSECGVRFAASRNFLFRIPNSALRIFRHFFDPPAQILDRAAVFEEVRQFLTGLRVGDGGENRSEELKRLRRHVIERPDRFQKDQSNISRSDV